MVGDGAGCKRSIDCYLYGEGEEVSVEGAEEWLAVMVGNPGAPARSSKNKRRQGISAGAVTKVERQGGELNLASLLRVRGRYFTQSAAFGSPVFVEEVFERNREKSQMKRQSGARESKQAGGGGRWCGFVDLRSPS